MGKVLEHIVANRLAYLVTTHNLVPANQFGGRPASSTDDAILTFIHDIEAAHNHDCVTSALTFDIKGFFDFVNHGRLLSVMHAKCIPLQLVQWTATFLSDREAAICLDGIRRQMQAVQNGIPQGSPASPILSIIYAAELLEIFEQAAREHEEMVRGLSQDHIRRLYTACVRPILTYASPAWWRGKKKQETVEMNSHSSTGWMV